MSAPAQATAPEISPPKPPEAAPPKGPDAATSVLGDGWEYGPRDYLLNALATTRLAADRSAVGRHFYRLSNFDAVAQAYRGVLIENVSLADRILWIRACLRCARGFEARWMLPHVLKSDVALSELSGREARSIIDLVFEAPIELEQKRSYMTDWLDRGGLQPATLAHLNFQKFRLDIGEGTDVDVVPLIGAHDPKHELDSWLRYVSYAKLAGRLDLVEPTLRSLLQAPDGPSAEVLAAAITYDPQIVVDEVDFAGLSGQFLATPRLLGQLATYRTLFSDAVERGQAALVAAYADASIYDKNATLALFLQHDLLDLANKAIDADQLPDTVLPAINAKGLSAFERGDYYYARECFTQVMRQNPADSAAAGGLRFCLPRTGATIADILTVRDELGYGVSSGGIPGRRPSVGNEMTIALLFSGSYVPGLVTKGLLPHWQALKRALGDRFLNYELLPDGKGKSLFVIADDGVSDEVRTAQFYNSLSQRFDRITIACDPRLEGLLQRSFPSITFVPSFRNRKGLDDRVGRLGTRSAFLNGVLSKFLTIEAEAHLQEADYITFGQSLFFNHFMGHLPRSEGAYLVPAHPRPKGERRRIGLIWRSHLTTGWRRAMYLDVEEFAPLLNVSADFVSIQHMITADEQAFCNKAGISIPEDVDLYNDFEAIADLTAGMDLVIGLSTLPIELAAAVGTPVWMLGYSPENYFLRTANGASEVDRYTANSTIIAPPGMDFSMPKTQCVAAVMAEAVRRLS